MVLLQSLFVVSVLNSVIISGLLLGDFLEVQRWPFDSIYCSTKWQACGQWYYVSETYFIIKDSLKGVNLAQLGVDAQPTWVSHLGLAI